MEAAQHQAEPTTMTTRQLAIDVYKVTGIELDSQSVTYMTKFKARLLMALGMQDREGALSFITDSVQWHLDKAGVNARLTSSVLEEIVAKHKWEMIHNAIAMHPNAKRTIESWCRQLLGQGAQSGAPQPAQPPSHPLDGVQQGPSTPAVSRRQPGPAAPAGSSTPAVSRNSQRGQAGNVHHIGSASPARGGAQGQGDPQDAAQGERKYDQVKVHGRKAALTVESDATRHGDPTVRIEAARMLDSAARTYDWRNKVAVQLTPTELQVVAGVLLGFLPSCKFQNHGPEQDKWFELEAQTGQYAGTIKVVVGKGKDLMIVQTTPADIGSLTSLVVRQAIAQLRFQPEASAAALLVLRRVAEQHRAKLGSAPPQRNAQAG